jgi:hypothetical protein
MKRQSRREMIEGIQYAAFWLANEIHSLPRESALATLLREISDEAIDCVMSCSSAGRQTVAVLTGALATKLRGDPHKDYALEWTEGEELESEIMLASILHLEQLRRAGMREVMSVPVDPWASDARFEYRTARGRVHRLDVRELMERFLPDPWRPPADFATSDVAARRHHRRMSKRRQSAWSYGSLFPSSPATGHVC